MTNVSPSSRPDPSAPMTSEREQAPVVLRPDTYDQPTGWTGWVGFAGVMMMIGGSLNIIWGIVALVNSHWVAWNHPTNLTLSVHSWGWALLIFGVVVLVSGFGVLTGNLAARIVGISVAAVGMIGNFFVVPLYPFWGLTIIAIEALVIWALAAHGREMKEV